MMYKLVVSGFDGTLIDQWEAISLSTMLEIDKVRKKGVLFAVASGRCLADILYYNRDFSFLDYIIASNGAVVYDVKKEKVIFKKSLSKVIIKKIFKNFEEEIFALRKDKKFILKDLEEIDDIYKLEIVCKSSLEAKDVIEKLKKLSLNITYYTEEVNGKCYVEVTSLGVNKAQGVRKICDDRKIRIDEVCAIGDGENDLEMLQEVALAGSVSNGVEKVRKATNVKVKSNEEKGVEEFLREIFK